MTDPRPDPAQPPLPTDPDIAADDTGASALTESLGKLAEANTETQSAPEAAMESRRQRLTGSAVGVGSVAFDDDGAFDVGAGESVARSRPKAPAS